MPEAFNGGLALGERGERLRRRTACSFTAKPVLSCHHRWLCSALPPDEPLPVHYLRRLQGCALPPATLRSPHSSLRSAPGRWRFGFLSLLSRHIYWSLFTGL